MVNAQEWLDKEYPKGERAEIQKIYLNEPTLEGELDLGDFINKDDIKVYISASVDEAKLIFKNSPGKSKIIKLIQAQGYINQKYPTKEKRAKIKELNISSWSRKDQKEKNDWKNLEDELDLSDFVNLKKLDCSCNFLTNIILPDLSKRSFFFKSG